MTRSKYEEQREAAIRKIALDALSIPTLVAQGSDASDFHSLGVWNIRQALLRAYEAGNRAAADHA
jgi:hypothetical protein